MVKKNTQIRLWKSRNQREEVRHIMDEAIDDVHNGKSVGILLPTHDKLKAFANFVLINAQHESWECKNNKYGGPDYDDLNKYFAKCDVPIQCVVNGYGDFLAPGNKITLITYHSAKGLDFDNVFLPFCNEIAYAGNTMSKRVFMVAMTRSRENLFISYSADHMNQWVKTFASNVRTRIGTMKACSRCSLLKLLLSLHRQIKMTIVAYLDSNNGETIQLHITSKEV